jgi:hypothetical protein
MGKNVKQNRKLRIIVLALFAFFALIWALLPEKIIFNSEAVCMHYKWLGLQCPLCGLSRAGYSILHLRPGEAWQYNPLIFYIIWLYVLEWISLMHIPFFMHVRKISWWVGLVLAIILYGIRIFSEINQG